MENEQATRSIRSLLWGCSGSSEVHIEEPRLCWGIVVGEAGDMGQPSVLYKSTMGYK